MRLLVYEYASGGGFGALPAPPEILAQGRAMRDALCLDLEQAGVSFAAAASASTAAGLACDIESAQSGESASQLLTRLADDYTAVWLIAPESDGIALALAALLDRLGLNRIGATAACIALASSKSRLLHRLAQAGLPCVASWPCQHAPWQNCPDWVIKPDCGCGSEAVRRVAAERGRQIAIEIGEGEADKLIAQPWIAGQPMSLSLLATAQGVPPTS